MHSMANASAMFEMDFRPPVRVIASTRGLVSELCQRIFGDADAASRVALTAHEMLENVAKYSSDGKSCIEIEVSHHEARSFVVIRTKNRAGHDQLDKLRLFLQEMQSSSDPVAFYDQVIARSVQVEGSGLGLARIRAEAEMDLAVSIERDEVTISAETQLAARACA